MTQGQRESLYFIYVNVCNGLAYSEDLYNDKELSPSVRSAVRVIKERLAWIKKAMDIKTNTDISKKVDTMMYDNVFRLLCNLPEEYQNEFEDMLIKFIKKIDENISN